MTFKPFAAGACAALSTLALSSSALAQQAPALSHGAPVNGVCIFSIGDAIGGSTVGKYVDSRLEQLEGQVTAELTSEKTAIDNDARTLDSQRATLDQNAFEQRGGALQARANAFNRKAQVRQRELQVTQQKALERINKEMEPLVAQAYQQKGCAVLLNREAVILANPAMDLTPQVVTALNAKITQFTFDRERLDQAAGAPAPQAPSARPAAPATPAPARKK